MRKCDICQTPIPLGQDHCPNCGYRMPKERGASQSQRETKKKIYMAQFQPHPNPSNRIKMPRQIDWANKKRMPKGIRKWIILMISIFLVPTFTSLMIGLVRSVSDFVTENNEMEEIDFPAFESFDNLVALEKAHPEIAKEISTVQEQAKKKLPNLDNCYMYESYHLEDQTLNDAYFSYSWPDGIYDVSAIYFYYDGVWSETIEYYVYAGDDEDPTLSKEVAYFMANYMEASKNDFYRACLQLFENNKNNEILDDNVSYKNIDIELLFSVDEEDNWEYYDLSATRELE